MKIDYRQRSLTPKQIRNKFLCIIIGLVLSMAGIIIAVDTSSSAIFFISIGSVLIILLVCILNYILSLVNFYIQI